MDNLINRFWLNQMITLLTTKLKHVLVRTPRLYQRLASNTNREVFKTTLVQTDLGFSNGGEDAWDVLALAGRFSNGRTVRENTILSLGEGKFSCNRVNLGVIYSTLGVSYPWSRFVDMWRRNSASTAVCQPIPKKGGRFFFIVSGEIAIFKFVEGGKNPTSYNYGKFYLKLNINQFI